MITAQLATIPARIEILPQVINSLLPQVDRLNVMCNNYNVIQALDVIKHCYVGEKLKLLKRQNQKTDAEKYWQIEQAEPGYIFTCDDDILYPPDYVQKSIEAIEKYNREYVITYHGRVFSELPIKSFYTSRKEMYRCLYDVEGDHIVDCGGDGVMAWHTDTFKMRYDYCEYPNMSQLWIALKCNQDNVKQMCIGHKEGWLQNLWDGEGIWDLENQNCQIQTELVNTKWIVR